MESMPDLEAVHIPVNPKKVLSLVMLGVGEVNYEDALLTIIYSIDQFRDHIPQYHVFTKTFEYLTQLDRGNFTHSLNGHRESYEPLVLEYYTLSRFVALGPGTSELPYLNFCSHLNSTPNLLTGLSPNIFRLTKGNYP